MSQLTSAVELALFIAGNYLGLLLLLGAAWSVGRTITRRLPYRDALEAAVVSTALGLGTWSTMLFLLGLVGLFRPVPILLLVVVSQAFARRQWVVAWQAVRGWLVRPRSVAWILAAALLAVLMAPLFTLPLYPPTAFDATMFHLPLADSIAQGGRIEFFEDLRYPVFPELQEVLYAVAVLLGSDIGAALVHFGCFLLVGMLLYCWGSWIASPRAGLWAALLWLGVTAAVKAAMGAYVDCGLTLYVATAVFALHRYARRADAGWLTVAAALVGFGAATKYHGLYFVCVLTLGVAIYTLVRGRWRHLFRWAAVLGAVVVPWYGFIYYHTGNPIFPFFPAVFGVSPWAFELRYSGPMPATQVDTGPLALLGKIGLLFRILFNKAMLLFDRSLLKTLLIPVDIFRASHSYKGEGLSPLFLFGLPLVVVMLFRYRHARYLAGVAGFYMVAWAATAQDLRYILPALPLLALLGAEGVDRLLGRLTPSRWPWIASLLTLALAVPLCLQIHRVSSGIAWTFGRPPTTEEQRERFLERRLPAYPAVRALNERFGSDYTVYTLFGENLKHYTDGRHLGDWFGPSRYGRILGRLMNRDALHQALSRMGVEYFVVPDLDTWKERLSAQFGLPSPRRLSPAFEIVFRDEHTTVYRLVPGYTPGDEPAGSAPAEPGHLEDAGATTGRGVESDSDRSAQPPPRDPVIDPGDQPAEGGSRGRGPEEAEERTDGGHGVAGKEVTQELQMLPHVGAAPDDEPDGGDEEPRAAQNSEDDGHDPRPQPGDGSQDELFFEGPVCHEISSPTGGMGSGPRSAPVAG